MYPDLLVYSYYYKCIPFGSIDIKNPEIMRLATLLGRTPSAVRMKMWNLAFFDPAQQQRNVSGLRNTSRTDEEVVKRFLNNQSALVHLAQEIEENLIQEKEQTS